MSTGAASMQKNVLCCISAGHECLQWQLSQTSPMKERTFVEQLWEWDGAACCKKKSILFFEAFEIYSLMQPWDILLWVWDVQAMSTGMESSLALSETNPGHQQRKWTDLLGVEPAIQMQDLDSFLVRSCLRITFRELYSSVCTTELCLSFVIQPMVDDTTFRALEEYAPYSYFERCLTGL